MADLFPHVTPPTWANLSFQTGYRVYASIDAKYVAYDPADKEIYYGESAFDAWEACWVHHKVRVEDEVLKREAALDLVSTARVLLCSALPDPTVSATEWRTALKNWLDAAHDLIGS